MAKTYRDIVLADEPALYLPLDDLRAYTAPDLSGNGLDGSINSSEFGDPLIAASPCSRQLGAGSGYVIAPWSSQLNISGDLTIEVWASIGNFVTGSTLISHAADGETLATNVLYQLYLDTDRSLLGFHESGSGVNVYCASSLICPMDEVVLITLERNTSDKTYTFYLNDDQSETVGYASNPAGGTSGSCRVRVGGINQTSQQNNIAWRGAHCAIYPRRLDSDARARRVHAGRGLPIAGSVGQGSPTAPAKRNIVFLSLPRALVLGTAVSDADDGTYLAQTAALERESVLGIAYVDYGDPPDRSATYAIGDRCWVGEPAPYGHWYECEAAGTSGSTEPTWPTDGSTVVDGTVTWRDKGLMERPWAEGPYLAEAV